VGGKCRGRRIVCPKGAFIRPATDRVRTVIFDILAGEIEGARVLDLFAGCGSLGLEALSRGAREVVFVEIDRRCCSSIEENIEELGFKEQGCVLRDDVRRAIRRMERSDERFNIIFADPPYKAKWAFGLVNVLGDFLKEGGILVFEHPKDVEMIEETDKVALMRRKDFGSTRVSFYRRVR